MEDNTFVTNCPTLIFGNHTDFKSVNGVSARWFELNSGIKVKIIWELWLGFTGRLKFAPKYDSPIQMNPYEFPGFGLVDRTHNWSFDYYIFYRIPFSKKSKTINN